LLRRHFFLAASVLMLILMMVAGGVKLAFGKRAGGSAAATAAQKGGAGRPAPVSVVSVQPRVFTDSIDVIGLAKGRQSVTLTAATTQLVDKVRFRDGEAVARGAVLVELKAVEQDAGLVQARARLVQAERDYQRWQALGARGFAAKTDLDAHEAAYLSAKADVDAARARQADRVIRAPFAGVVGLSDIAPGALVNPGALIVTLDDLSAVRVDFEVPERQLAALHEGQPISATVDAPPATATL